MIHHATNYEYLDALIVAAIKRGEQPLLSRAVSREARRIGELLRREEIRVVDARLQALRKAGLILGSRIEEAGWTVVAENGSDNVQA